MDTYRGLILFPGGNRSIK